MAITINTAPVLLNAAYHPIIFEVSSDRYASDVYSITSVSSGTGAFARYAVASHTYKVGDIVTGSAFTSTSAAYNVRQTVTVISGSYFETDLAFVTGGTGAGTMTRTNDNFQMKCETLAFDLDKKTITNCGNNGGFAQFTTSATHFFSVGSVVYIQDTASGNYDGIATVTAVTSNTFITDQAYIATTSVGGVRDSRVVGSKFQSVVTISGTPQFRMNCAGHLESIMSLDLFDSEPTNIQTPLPNSLKLFAIRFTESYDDVDGLYTESDLKYSSVATATRAVLQRVDGVNINSAYVINPPTSFKFLTEAPNNKLIRVGEEEQLHFLYSGTTQLRAGITKYNLAGVAQAEVYTTLTTISDYKGVLPINSNHFDNTVSKFDIWLVDSVPNAYSELRTFIVDKRNYQNPVRIYFESNLGLDAFTFNGAYKENLTTNKTTYQKSLPLTYSLKDRSLTDIYVSAEKTHEAYSDFLPKATAQWLERLLGSSNLYIKQIGDTYFTPISLLPGSSVIYDSRGLVQIKIDYAKSVNNLTIGN